MTVPSRLQAARPLLLAIGYGAVAGAIAAATFALMKLLQHVLWLAGDARWYVFLVVATGGALLAWLRANSDDVNLGAQLAAAADPRALRRKKTAFLALSAIIAVGFGGSIGPEAGLLAVVAQLSAIVSDRVARSREEAHLIGQAGNSAALAGLYGSPPAGGVGWIAIRCAASRSARSGLKTAFYRSATSLRMNTQSVIETVKAAKPLTGRSSRR